MEIYINGQKLESNDNLIAYDGCHKFYVLENYEEGKQAINQGWNILTFDHFIKEWPNSCCLRFLRNWNLTKCYVKQFEDMTITFKGGVD